MNSSSPSNFREKFDQYKFSLIQNVTFFLTFGQYIKCFSNFKLNTFYFQGGSLERWEFEQQLVLPCYHHQLTRYSFAVDSSHGLEGPKVRAVFLGEICRVLKKYETQASFFWEIMVIYVIYDIWHIYNDKSLNISRLEPNFVEIHPLSLHRSIPSQANSPWGDPRLAQAMTPGMKELVEEMLITFTLEFNIDTPKGHVWNEIPFPNHYFGYPCSKPWLFGLHWRLYYPDR